MTSATRRRHDPSDGPDQEPGPGAPRLRDQLLGLEHHRAPGRAVQRRTRASTHAEVPAGRHARTRRLAGPDTRRRIDRPYGGRRDVHGAHPGDAVPVLLVAFAGRSSRTRCCWCSASSSAWPARRSPSASRSSTPGSNQPGAGSRPASSAPAWAAPHCRRSSPEVGADWFGYIPTHLLIAVALVVVGGGPLAADAGLTRLEAQHRPGGTQAGRRREAAAHLADVVPLRGGFRRLRGLLDLPADISQERLGFDLTGAGTRTAASPSQR